MTYKNWLYHMLQVTNEADIAVAKALRQMLGVCKNYFSGILRQIRLKKFRNGGCFGKIAIQNSGKSSETNRFVKNCQVV